MKELSQIIFKELDRCLGRRLERRLCGRADDTTNPDPVINNKLGTGLFFGVLSRPAAPAAGQLLADDPSELCLPRPLELSLLSL